MANVAELNSNYSGRILGKKFKQYFFPSIITAVALSLSEFVDSMIVSNLLNSHALAIINVGCPIMFIMAAIYLLIGRGGAVIYSSFLGKRDEKGAGGILTVSIGLALVVGIVLMFFGLLFTKPIANLLCPGLTLGNELITYLKTLMVSMPFLITVLTAVMFLPASGSPKASMFVNVAANVLNLILDIVFIRVFGMGVSGAALATTVSYCISFIAIIVLAFLKKINISLVKINKTHIISIPNILGCGISSSLSQIGFALKFAYCNSVVTKLGGNDGIIAMSLCQQTLSIVSIFLAGANETISPFISMLKAQSDFKGVEYILKKALKIILVISFICVVLFEAFPQVITTIYNVTDQKTIEVAINGIRIFSLCYVFRTVAMLFMTYVNSIRKPVYATFISLFDGFVGIIAIGVVMTWLFGLDGMWWTFTVDAFLLFVTIIIANLILGKKSNGKYHGPLLLEKERESVKVLNISFAEENENVSTASIQSQEFCEENGINRKVSMMVGLAVEEMTEFTKTRAGSNDIFDVILRITPYDITLDFRNEGSPFDPMAVTEDDGYLSITLIHSIAKKIEYGYIMGLNSTKLIIDRGEKT